MGLLKHRDGLVERAAMARVVAVDGSGPERLAVGARELPQGRLDHGHIVALVLTALADRTIQIGHPISPPVTNG